MSSKLSLAGVFAYLIGSGALFGGIITSCTVVMLLGIAMVMIGLISTTTHIDNNAD